MSAEIVAGVAAGSSSLQADALDFVGDAANYAISLTVAGMVLQWRARAALLEGGDPACLRALWAARQHRTACLCRDAAASEVMGVVGLLALLANGAVALMLNRYREGDANMRSV